MTGTAGARPTPWDLVFGELGPARFPGLAADLDEGGTDPFDRDGFLIRRPVVEFLRELRPDGGLGDGIGELAALVHLAFLYWRAGGPMLLLSEATLDRLIQGDPGQSTVGSARAYYVQLPPRKVWGNAVEGGAAEPLDGCFVARRGAECSVVGVFGLHPQRDGFTVVAVTGSAPALIVRADGTQLFAPVLAGGEQAGLHSIIGMDELLELAWRIDRPALNALSSDAGGPA